MVAGILEKSNRFRLAVFCCAMYKAPNSVATRSYRGPPASAAFALDGVGCATGCAPSHMDKAEEKRNLVSKFCAKTQLRSQRQKSPSAPRQASCNPITN